ncbi:hypothetical protein [Micromonospora sp. 067-2]|uniref:hypothetical protein n=1 Tax=Micromonospora sp. 067-2 TaxID=2789270 RepID=UPI0039792843
MTLPLASTAAFLLALLPAVAGSGGGVLLLPAFTFNWAVSLCAYVRVEAAWGFAPSVMWCPIG